MSGRSRHTGLRSPTSRSYWDVLGAPPGLPDGWKTVGCEAVFLLFGGFLLARWFIKEHGRPSRCPDSEQTCPRTGDRRRWVGLFCSQTGKRNSSSCSYCMEYSVFVFQAAGGRQEGDFTVTWACPPCQRLDLTRQECDTAMEREGGCRRGASCCSPSPLGFFPNPHK